MEGKRLSKSLSEENDELKLYIDSLNKECMELQAVLFEEANKMAQKAYASEYNALKRAEEAEKENSVLKKELKALKNSLRVQYEGTPDQLAVRRSVSSIPPRGSSTDEEAKINGFRRFGFLRNSTSSDSSSNATATLPNQITCNNGSPKSVRKHRKSNSVTALTTSIVNVTSEEPVTRRHLVEALTSNSTCSEVVSDQHFQEFLEWVDGGCRLSWPEPERVPVKITLSEESEEVGLTDNRGAFFRKRTESDAGDIQLPSGAYQQSSQLSLESVPQSKQLIFFHRLVQEDILPALDFGNRRLCEALKQALGRLGVEMEPLSSVSSSSKAPTCPLVPGKPVKYSLKLEILGPDGRRETECCDISEWARERIAAVADLFQYLSLIHRGLTGTPTTPTATTVSSRSSTARNSGHTSPGLDREPLEEATRRHQFENVQRRRLSIALSRLGYGLPSME